MIGIYAGCLGIFVFGGGYGVLTIVANTYSLQVSPTALLSNQRNEQLDAVSFDATNPDKN
jgi:hypothetical protein